MVIFSNSIGDITAADIETGLIVWQLPLKAAISSMKLTALKFHN
jgi:hypothetical protein